MKFSVIANIQKTPEQYTQAKWQYINASGQDYYKKAEVDADKAAIISKLLADNDFSNNPELETNIFEELPKPTQRIADNAAATNCERLAYKMLGNGCIEKGIPSVPLTVCNPHMKLYFFKI